MNRLRRVFMLDSRLYFLVVSFLLTFSWTLSANTRAPLNQAENFFFTGLDMYWMEGAKKFPVQAYSRKRIKIQKNGKLVSVRRGGSLVYESRKKVTQEILNLKIESIGTEYSGLHSDYEALQSTFGLLAVEEDIFEFNATSFYDPGSRYSIAMKGESLLSGSSVEAMSRTQSTIEAFENVRYDLQENLNSAAALVDTLRIKGELQLPAGVKEGYLVFLVRYSAAGDSESKLRPVHHGYKRKANEAPFEFDYAFPGFPSGFQVHDVRVHVFSGGEEIPHQDSPKLRGMSDLEFYEYLFSKYKKSSGRDEPVLFRPLDAEAVAELAPSKELTRIKIEMVVLPDGSTRVDYVNVGYVEDQQPLVALIEQARFFPAMEDGELVESTLYVPLSSLVQ